MDNQPIATTLSWSSINTIFLRVGSVVNKYFSRCAIKHQVRNAPARTYNDSKITLTLMPAYHRKDCLRMIFVWSWKLYFQKFDSKSFMCIYIRVLLFIVQRNIQNRTNGIRSEILKTNCIKLLVWIHLFSIDNQSSSSFVFYCIVLYCIVLYCIVLYCNCIVIKSLHNNFKK